MMPRGPPTLELPGVRLRPLRPGDVEALYGYLLRPEVTERTSYPPVTEALAASIIERHLERWASGGLGKLGVVLPDEDRLVGTCGFNDGSAPHRWAELAFDLDPAHWGRGLMRQAVLGLLEWLFAGDEVDRVHAFVRVDNARSSGLLARVGFVREGTLRSFRVCRGQPHDFDVFALRAPVETGRG